MQVIENLKIKEKLYIEKLENGLTVMIIPKENTNKKYIMWGTNFGSIDNHFIISKTKQEITVPDGVAHFLEHKMFEQKSGINSLDTLSSIGVDANAYTTNDYTTYLYECNEHFYEALDEFMDYVQHPYFTDQNVEKEKGIIGQEIMMYDDYPEWAVYMNALKCMYKNNAITIDIAGSIDSIAKIDKDVLYKCYNTFYNPSNMIMGFCGDFEPEELIEEIKKRLIEKPNQGEIKRIYDPKEEGIVSKIKKTQMEVSMPIFVIGIKDDTSNTKEEIVKKHLAIEILLNMIIGKSSRTYKKLYEEQLLISEPFVEYEFGDNFAHIAITGQSKNPELVLKEIQEEINNLKQNGLDEEHFNRIKNMLYGTAVKEFNNVSDIVRMFISDYFKGINSFDYLETYKQITKEYAKQILNDVFKEENTVISVVEPKDKTN